MGWLWLIVAVPALAGAIVVILYQQVRMRMLENGLTISHAARLGRGVTWSRSGRAEIAPEPRARRIAGHDPAGQPPGCAEVTMLRADDHGKLMAIASEASDAAR